MTNASVGIEEEDTVKNLKITDASVGVEEVDTIANLRVTDASVGVEEVDTISYIRMSDAAVMVEYIDNLGDYCGPGDVGLVTYLEFARGLHCYLSREADEEGLSITGALTLGGWVYFDTQSRGFPTAILGKWYEPTDNRSYVLYKKSSGEITFAISTAGNSAVVEVNDGGENYEIQHWKYIVGRFTPSAELALFINGKWYTNVIGIPATIYDGTEPFEIARYNRDNYFDGRLCHMFVSAEAVDVADIEAMYAHTKAMFQGPEEGQEIHPTGISERVTNAALMIVYEAKTYLRVTNSALMIEYTTSSSSSTSTSSSSTSSTSSSTSSTSSSTSSSTTSSSSTEIP